VEHGHGVLKNDLGGGVLPCGRFGANAAWWRLNVLAANLLAYLQAGPLPAALRKVRPKALRFCLFYLAGRVVRHARSWPSGRDEPTIMAQAVGLTPFPPPA